MPTRKSLIVRDSEEYLPPARLYLDDLREIIVILSELSNDIKIENKEYNFENIEDISKLEFEKIDDLKISVKDKINIIFSKTNIEINIPNNSNELRGAVEKIKNILRIRRRKFLLFWYNFYCCSPYRFLFQCIFIFMLFVLFGIIAVSNSPEFISKNLDNEGVKTIFSYGYSITFFAVCIIIYRKVIKYTSENIIYTKYKKELPNFVQRKKDDIVLSIISILFGALISKYIF